MRKSKRLVSCITASVLAMVSALSAVPWLPVTSVPVYAADENPGYHKENKTYTIEYLGEFKYSGGCCEWLHGVGTANTGWEITCTDSWGYYDESGNKHVLAGANSYKSKSCGCGQCGTVADYGGWRPMTCAEQAGCDGKSPDTYFGATNSLRTGDTYTVMGTDWIPNTYNIVFNPNNGQSTFTRQATYGTRYQNMVGTGTFFSGYELQGWYTGADGSGEMIYDAGGKAVSSSFWNGSGSTATCRWAASHNASLNVYAYWKTSTRSVTLNAGTGIASVSGGGTKQIGSSVTITSATSTGYTNPCWREDRTGAGTAWGNSYTFNMPDRDISFTASASPRTYTVVFNAGGGSPRPGSISVAYDSSAGSSVPAAVISRDGYVLEGWADASGVMVYDASGNAVVNTSGLSYWQSSAQGMIWKYAEDVTTVNVYAKWSDTSNPTVSAFPALTSSWAASVPITITAYDNEALASGTVYQYCFAESSSAPDGAWQSYQNGSESMLGGSLSGTYYLWVKGVTDTSGNASSPTGLHRFGPYYFDNTVPDISSVQNSYTAPSGDTNLTLSFDITDLHSGIGKITLYDINDTELADLTGGDHSYTFSASGINFYSITAVDTAGNTSKKMFSVSIGSPAAAVPDGAVWKGEASLILYRRWMPIKYTIRFDKNDGDSETKAAGSMADVPAVYDVPFNIPANGFSRDGYIFTGWNTAADGTGRSFADKEESIANLTDADGQTIVFYAQWKDETAPVITVTPTHTTNPDVENDAVRSVDITIKISDTGSGLSPANNYEYGFSTNLLSPPESWTQYCPFSVTSSFSAVLDELGSTYTGYYYLWIRQISDRCGNLSVSDEALAVIDSCHIYGVYAFDNSAPSGTAKYIENNTTLGLYNGTVTDSPYAVMTISDASDDMAGISHFTLLISDVEDSGNTAVYDFVENHGSYFCRFNLYDCLSDFDNVRHVNMYIKSHDLLGNSSTIPITSYDFGTMQNGSPIQAEDIGFHLSGTDSDITAVPAALPHDKYIYERDAFRIEAYIENISHGSRGTTFMGGQKGILRIYTFGNVHAVYADFGSVKKFINPIYDISPDLGITTLSPFLTTHIYMHEFFIPLYCASSTYTDTTAYGVKKAAVQHRNVTYDVDGTLTNNIRTILKYNAD